MLGHERLRAWELCYQLVLLVYRSSERWPKEERYGLTSQIRRAAVSAAANIAEGQESEEIVNSAGISTLRWDPYQKLPVF
jgi:four helix bundle protein